MLPGELVFTLPLVIMVHIELLANTAHKCMFKNGSSEHVSGSPGLVGRSAIIEPNINCNVQGSANMIYILGLNTQGTGKSFNNCKYTVSRLTFFVYRDESIIKI